MPPWIATEHAHDRPHREANSPLYRLGHWALWVPVLFFATSPGMYTLFTQGPNGSILIQTLLLVALSAIAAIRGRLPGCEPVPYVLYFVEDKPNPWYRRVAYTAAWAALVAPTTVHVATLAALAFAGRSHMSRWRAGGYLAVAAATWFIGLSGRLPRTSRTTRHEAVERRRLYACVWATAVSHGALVIVLLTALPRTVRTPQAHAGRLAIFSVAFLFACYAAFRGRLPRTRLIVGRPHTAAPDYASD